MNFDQPSKNKSEVSLEKRSDLINGLRHALESDSRFIAAILEGADAHKTVDEYSDIDIRVIYEGDLNAVQSVVTSALQQFGEVDYTYVRREPNGTRLILHCAGTPKYLLFDILLQPYLEYNKYISKDKILLFDKLNILTEFNEMSGSEEIIARIEKLKSNGALRDIYFEREALRGNFLEALHQYQTLVLQPLVEILRLCYCPQYRDLQLKHVTKDLPYEVVVLLEDLYRVSSVEQIVEKKKQADDLFQKTFETISKKHKQIS